MLFEVQTSFFELKAAHLLRNICREMADKLREGFS